MVAEPVDGRNRCVARSVVGDADAADHVGLATAHPAGDGQDGEPVTRRESAHDVARLLETDPDLQGQAGSAEASFMPREDASEAIRERMRPV